MRAFNFRAGWLVLTVLLLLLAVDAMGQAPPGGLRGQVSDPSGAVVPKATVTATPSSGASAQATSDGQGQYQINGLPAGNYTVTVTAKGFSTYQKQDVAVSGDKVRLDVPLEIQVEQEKVTVEEENPATLDVSPSNNAGALIIKGADLDALSDDPDELQSELEALAGPSAGPNGGQIYIDGFTGGQLPPKASIREIRINQNPFSAEFDKIGYGRIEIFTKPGTDQFHGQFFVNGNASFLNSKNPFIAGDLQPDYASEMYNANLSGPINKHASFFVNAERRNVGNSAIVDANNVPPSFGFAAQGIPAPTTRTNITPRLDYQLSANNTLMVRYQFTQINESNQGVGQFDLASQAYNVSNTEQTLQISDTQVVSSRTINETRFQYIRDRDDSTALFPGATINVLGAFVGGGNPIGITAANQDHYELQNYTSMSLGSHFLKFGGRLRAVTDYTNSTQGFNGAFTYSGLTAFTAPPGQTIPGTSQFTITTGSPATKLTLFDAGLYAQDDWRIRPNMTLSYGLRFETQNHISDHVNLAPRLAFAWGLGKGKTPPKTVIRAGFGIFYDRFTDALASQQERLLNDIGATQQFMVSSPTFGDQTVPPGVPAGALATVYQNNPNLRAPYMVQSAVAVERQVTKNAIVSLTYLNSRGFDQLLTRNINAPLSNGSRPFGADENIYQYTSEGVFKQNQLIANFRVSVGTRLSLFGFYMLGFANSDTAGANSFPSDQYDILADYGRAVFDVRQRLALGGNISLPHGFALSPFVLANSGKPFNITLGSDQSGAGILNVSRPAFCSAATVNCEHTAFGSFDLAPVAGEQIVPINYGTGPGQFTFNLRVSKTFYFGAKQETAMAAARPHGGGGGGGGGRGPMAGLGPRGLSSAGGGAWGSANPSKQRYSLTFSVAARNLFNNVNPGMPIGVLTSQQFGQSNSIAGGPFGTTSANRRIDLQARFNF